MGQEDREQEVLQDNIQEDAARDRISAAWN